MPLSPNCYHSLHHLCPGPQHCDCECHKVEEAEKQEDLMRETIESRRGLLQEAVRMLESATGTYDGKAQVMFRGRWYESSHAARLLAKDVADTEVTG